MTYQFVKTAQNSWAVDNPRFEASALKILSLELIVGTKSVDVYNKLVDMSEYLQHLGDINISTISDSVKPMSAKSFCRTEKGKFFGGVLMVYIALLTNDFKNFSVSE